MPEPTAVPADWNLTPAQIDQITELAYSQREWRIWKNKASGNQPGAWYASYLGDDRAMPRTLGSDTLDGLAGKLADPMAHSVVAH